MRNNVMSEVAGLLGLLIDEEFMVDEKIYMIDEDGLWIKENNQWRTSNDLENLLTGRKEFVKLPWKPKKGDGYYTFEIFRGKWVVRSLWWAKYLAVMLCLTKAGYTAQRKKQKMPCLKWLRK